jgi:hypothetical protein
MKKPITHYISELLFLHDCVIIPEFGGFVGNIKSAQLNTNTGFLIPPTKQILFNPNLKTNDGLLVAHIAKQEGLSQEIVRKNIDVFSNQSKSTLSNSKVLRFDKIGLLTITRENNIHFLQDNTTNYNLDVFGMKPISSKEILRKNETEKQITNTIRAIGKSSRSSKRIIRAAAVIIPLVTLSYLSLSHQERINDIYIQMAVFNPFAGNAEVVNSKKSESENKIFNNPKISNEQVSIIPTDSPKKYYIIAGVFVNQKNANKMLTKLKKWNYNAATLKDKKLLRISYDSFNNKEMAMLALTKIKQENPQAWILTK